MKSLNYRLITCLWLTPDVDSDTGTTRMGKIRWISLLQKIYMREMYMNKHSRVLVNDQWTVLCQVRLQVLTCRHVCLKIVGERNGYALLWFDTSVVLPLESHQVNVEHFGQLNQLCSARLHPLHSTKFTMDLIQFAFLKINKQTNFVKISGTQAHVYSLNLTLKKIIGRITFRTDFILFSTILFFTTIWLPKKNREKTFTLDFQNAKLC